MFGKADGTTELDAFYPIRPECIADVPKTRFKPRAGKTLSERRWHASFTQGGHLDIAQVLRRIQRGGIHPSIEGVVWEFLLGCYDPNSTFEERNQPKEQRRQQYNSWKDECQRVVPVIGTGKFITTPLIGDDGQPIDDSLIGVPLSDKKVLQWVQTLHQIGLDVVRTDRALVYECETNQAKLWDVLSIYTWLDDDIGYVQGMNDICSPMVMLLEDEADSFRCFERAMRRLRENFRTSASSMGVQSQLGTLSQIIKIVDPKLHQHLDELDAGGYLFAFRMLMVLFRREFSFADALYLWELRRTYMGPLGKNEDLYFFGFLVIFLRKMIAWSLYKLQIKKLILRHNIDCFQLMWGMEYNPNIFSLYENPETAQTQENAPLVSGKLLKQYGKFQRKNLTTGNTDQQRALAVFLVASVLEVKNRQILKEAKGVDDVVKGADFCMASYMNPSFQILGDITANLDAKKACTEALKIQKKYLSKTKKP